MKTCCWKNLITGQSVCDEPAAYIGYCDPCWYCVADGFAECQGANLCEKHAAESRKDPDLVRLTSLSVTA